MDVNELVGDKMKEYQDATAMAAAVRAGTVTAEELVSDALTRIKQLNQDLNAVVHVQAERALQEAHEREFSTQPFAGVPLLLKDLGQNQRGEPSSSGSRLFKDIPQKRNDTLVTKLEEAGFIIIGRTNTPEFGFKNMTEPQLWGVTSNPFDLHRNAGGSSGGAAAAVASGMAPLAMASDGGGSIRIPASFTGLIGLKPTRGRIPVGPNGYRGWQGASVNFALTKTVRDTRNLLAVLQVEQMEAPFIAPLLSQEQLSAPLQRPLKIAYIEKSPIESVVAPTAIAALQKGLHFLEERSHSITHIQWPVDGIELMKNYYVMNSVETAAMMSTIERSFGRKLTKDDMELMTWAIYQSGLNIRATDYSLALSRWDEWSHAMNRVHQQYDLIVTPTVSDVAPLHTQYPLSNELKQQLEQIDELSVAQQQALIWRMFEQTLALTPFTQLANITGQPAISLPLYQTEQGLPVGVQLMAAKGREDLLLQIAEQFEAAGQFCMNL